MNHQHFRLAARPCRGNTGKSISNILNSGGTTCFVLVSAPNAFQSCFPCTWGQLGVESTLKGVLFEWKVAKYFRAKGWRTTEDWFHRDGRQIDVYGEMGNELMLSKFLLVECKDTGRVTKADVDKFARKVMDFANSRTSPLQIGSASAFLAIIAYTGEASDAVIDYGKGMSPQIRFIRF